MRDDLHADEERELERRFGLTEAVVAGHGIDVGAPDGPAAFASVGPRRGALLMRRLQPEDVLGFTWGPEKVAVATALAPGVASCRVGRATRRRDVHRRLPDRHGVHPQPLRRRVAGQHDPSARPALRRPVDRRLDAQRLGDLADARGGPARRHDDVRRRCGVDLDHAVRGQLHRHRGCSTSCISLGAVGEIGGRFFDAEGTAVDTELQQRAISVPLDDIRACEKTILISSGATKHEATLGALGGLAKLLVCDIDCARWLLPV